MNRLFLLAAWAASVTLPAAADPDRLLAVWHFDEPSGARVLDASSNGLDGRMRGGKRVDGRFGRAVELDGVDDYVRCPSIGALEEGSAEIWVKLLKKPSGQAGFVTFGMGYGKRNDTAILGNAPTTPTSPPSPWSFGVYGDGWQTAKPATEVSLGQWHHVVGTWGRDGLQCYVDGKPIAGSTAWTGGLPSHAAVLMGASSWNSHTACVLDEVRLYSVALTAETVRDHWEHHGYVASPPQPSRSMAHLSRSAVANVADFYDVSHPTCGIQKAVDSLPARGGIVTIPPGTYLLKRGVRLRSKTALQGAGPSTILTRDAQVWSLLAQTAQQGERSFTVERVDGFEVGMEVGVNDSKQFGWHTTHTVITAVRGNVLEIDQPLKRTYMRERRALAANHFPAIEASHQRDVVVQDLCIDGNAEESPGVGRIDFTFEAIHFYNTSDSMIRRCVVRGWPSDGIGVQGGSNVKVLGCTASGCLGHGFHPGTSLQHAVFDANMGHHNGCDGLYFCANVRYIVVSNSVFHHNRGDGIGGLGGGGDRYNVVSSNVCRSNGRCGIDAAGGAENVIASNLCLNNSQAKAGRYPGILLHDATHTSVTGNRCLDDQDKPTQLRGICESGKSDYNLFSSNHLVTQTGEGLVMIGPKSQAHGNLAESQKQ